jgi:predicted DNA-binding ribbon-helix-helix protein
VAVGLAQAQLLRKRSFSIAGHRTSVAVEPEFWTVLEHEAHRRGLSLSAFVAQIDAARGTRPLASALRLAALAAESLTAASSSR